MNRVKEFDVGYEWLVLRLYEKIIQNSETTDDYLRKKFSDIYSELQRRIYMLGREIDQNTFHLTK